MRGYFGIGIYHVKTAANIGTLWRSAYQLGASFIFTVGKRYPPQASDTVKAWKHVPLYEYLHMDDLLDHLPRACPLIAVEMGGRPLSTYSHPERCAYLLGAEDNGLPDTVLAHCRQHISIEAWRHASYNVAVAGSIVMYARLAQHLQSLDNLRTLVLE